MKKIMCIFIFACILTPALSHSMHHLAAVLGVSLAGLVQVTVDDEDSPNLRYYFIPYEDLKLLLTNQMFISIENLKQMCQDALVECCNSFEDYGQHTCLIEIEKEDVFSVSYGSVSCGKICPPTGNITLS